MKMHEECCELSKASNIVCEENKKKFHLRNPKGKNVWKCRVDGCWIADGSIRCDFLIKVEEEKLFLIELKGTDHVHALEQLVATAEKLNVASFPGERLSVIVGAPCPKISTKYQKAQKALAVRYEKAKLSFPNRKNGTVLISI